MFFLIFLLIFTSQKFFDLTPNYYNLPGAEWDEIWIDWGYIWHKSMKKDEVVYLRFCSEKNYSYYFFTAWGYKDDHLRKDLPIDVYLNTKWYKPLSNPEKFKYGLGGFRKKNNEYFAIVPRAALTVKLQHSLSEPYIMKNMTIFK